MRALVVSNMRPDVSAPGRGVFVRDQVAALRALPDVDVELHELAPGPRGLVAGGLGLRRRFGAERFDVVHAHFGLTAWPAFAVRARARVLTVHGTDVRHPRTRRITGAALSRLDLVAAVSASLLAELPPPRGRARRAVLPCGVAMDRFHPIPRHEARAALGLEPDDPMLLFPADPARRVKRHDLALVAAGDVALRHLGGVEPGRVPLWINAANAVLVPSDAEGFGLAVLEALACDVPVLATPVGVHPLVLDDLPGTLCAPFQIERWRAALAPHVAADDPRVDGRGRAELFSAARMARRVLEAWRELVAGETGGIRG